MKPMLQWLVLALAVLASAGAAHAQQDEPWDKSGTPAGAMVNGIQASLKRANLGTRADAAGAATGPVTMPSIAAEYNRTYGPFLNGVNFHMTDFMGTPQRRGVIFWVIKMGFVIALMLTFVGVAYKANKGQASVSDLGWSMSKTGIAALVVLFPGGLYAMFIMLPVALTANLAHSGANATIDPNSTVAMRSENAMDDGIAAAEAVINGAMASCSQQSPEDYKAVYNLAEAAKALATSAHLQASVVNAITLPAKGADGEFQVQSAEAGDVLATKQKFRIVLHETVALWKYWGLPEIVNIKKIQSDGEKKLALCTTDMEQTATELRQMRLAAFNAMLPLLKEQILRRKAASVQPSPAVNRDAERLYAAGQVMAAPFLEANREVRSTGETVVNGVSNFMLGFLMPAIGAVWLFAIEILMIQLLIMAVFWIHPRTEASAVKAAKALFGVAFFLPLYLISFLAVQKLLGVLMPGNPIAEAGGTGIIDGVFSAVTNFVNVITWPMRAMFSVVYAILAPALAVPCAWFMLKALKSGGTLVGGFAKASLTSLGVAATMSVPALRLAGLATGGGLSAAAGSMTASAATSEGFRKRMLGGAAWAARTAASAVDYGQDAMGKAFGANDKYMNRSMTTQQNRRGAIAAMRAAAAGSVKAGISGGSTSSIIEHVEAKADLHEKLRAKDGGPGGDKTHATAEALVEAQRQTAKAQTKMVESLEELVKKLDRANETPRTNVGPVAPTVAGTIAAIGGRAEIPTPQPAVVATSLPGSTTAQSPKPVPVAVNVAVQTPAAPSSAIPPPPAAPKINANVTDSVVT